MEYSCVDHGVLYIYPKSATIYSIIFDAIILPDGINLGEQQEEHRRMRLQKGILVGLLVLIFTMIGTAAAEEYEDVGTQIAWNQTITVVSSVWRKSEAL